MNKKMFHEIHFRLEEEEFEILRKIVFDRRLSIGEVIRKFIKPMLKDYNKNLGNHDKNLEK